MVVTTFQLDQIKDMVRRKNYHFLWTDCGFWRPIKSVSNRRRQGSFKENSAKSLKGNSGRNSGATSRKTKLFQVTEKLCVCQIPSA